MEEWQEKAYEQGLLRGPKADAEVALITDRIIVDSHLLSGQWEVVDSDGCRAGRCTTSDSAIQGISAALRLVGAKVGDAFRLRFDVDTKRVEIQRVLAEGCSEPVG